MGCKYCGMPPGGEPGDGCCKAAALDSCRAALEIQRKRIAALEAEIQVVTAPHESVGGIMRAKNERIATLEAALDRAEHHMKYAISEIVSPEWLIDDIQTAIKDVRALRGEDKP